MIYLNLGRREVGKTTLACYLVSKSPTRIVFDPRGLYPSAQRARTTEDVANWFRDPLLGQLVITPDDDVQSCFDITCAYVKSWLRSGRSDIGFLVDELRFIKNVDGPDLNWILRCATRNSVVVVMTAHRPSDVPPDIRAISDMWCVFQMTQEHDLKVVTERCSPQVAALVARLRPRQFVAWNDALGTMKVYAKPDQWFVPLEAVSAVAARPTGSPIDDLSGEAFADGNSRFDFTK